MPKTFASWPNPLVGRGRRKGDRRRRLLLRRALLPGRPSLESRSAKRTQPASATSRRQATTTLIGGGKDIASWEAPQFRDCATACPPSLSATLEYVEPNAWTSIPARWKAIATFGITVEPEATLTRRSAVGGALERGADRPRRLPARHKRQADSPKAAKVATARQRDQNAAAVRVPRLGKQNWRPAGSAAGDQPLHRVGEADSPRLKFALLENGGGVTSTEYPESRRRRRGRADDLRPQRRRRRDQRRRGPLDDFETHRRTTPRAGPVTHYFGPVNGTTPAEPLRLRKSSPSPTSSPPTAALTRSSAPVVSKHLALLRHLGCGSACGRGGGAERQAEAGCNGGGSRGRSEPGAARNRRPGRGVRPARPGDRRRARRTLSQRSPDLASRHRSHGTGSRHRAGRAEELRPAAARLRPDWGSKLRPPTSPPAVTAEPPVADHRRAAEHPSSASIPRR